MRKRITSILMACMLLVSMIPSAFAASDNSFTDVSSTDWYYAVSYTHLTLPTT